MPIKSLDQVLERFAVPIPEAGCWIWVGGMRGKGYGQANEGGRNSKRSLLAHRVVYEIANGPIPDGMMVCHRCDVPACVNPSHLFLGTAKDNNRDRHRKGRTAVGKKNGKAVLNPDVVRAIRAHPFTHRQMAVALGMSYSAIQMARSGKTWGHVQ